MRSRHVEKFNHDEDAPDYDAEIEDEFFWNLDEAVNAMTALGFATSSQLFSGLSWGILATKPTR